MKMLSDREALAKTRKTFLWVTLKDDKMFCETCSKNTSISDKESSFVKAGCSNFDIKALQTHNISHGHKKSSAHQNALLHPGTNPAEKALQVMHEQHFQKLRLFFLTAHSIPKKG